jgi:hypothetical protein
LNLFNYDRLRFLRTNIKDLLATTPKPDTSLCKAAMHRVFDGDRVSSLVLGVNDPAVHTVVNTVIERTSRGTADA